jgi:hypothetical protein
MTKAKEILKRQKKRGLSPKDFEAVMQAYKKFRSKKEQPKGQWERDREPAEKIPDINMIMARELGYKIKPADINARKPTDPQTQFITVLEKGPFEYFDDRIASALLGFFDEHSINSADELAGILDGISDFFKKIGTEGELPPKEESDLRGEIEKFRKKTMGEFPTTAAAGRFLSMALPLFWGKRVAQGGLGLLSLMGEKVGFKKTADFFEAVEKIGNKNKWADEGLIVAEAIRKSGAKGIEANTLRNLYRMQRFAPRTAAAGVGATKGMVEEGLYTGLAEDEPSFGLSTALSGAIGGGMGAKRRSAQMAGREKSRVRREFLEEGLFSKERLGLSNESLRMIRKYKKDMVEDPQEYMKDFGDRIEDIVNIKDNANSLALASLQKQEKNIPVKELRDLAENHYIAAISDVMSDRDLLIASAWLRANQDKTVARELLKEWGVDLLKFEPIAKGKKGRLLLLPQKGKVPVIKKEDSLMQEIERVQGEIENKFKKGNNQIVGGFLEDLEEFIDNINKYDVMREFVGKDKKLISAYKKNPEVFIKVYTARNPQKGRRLLVNLDNLKKRLDPDADETVPMISERELRSELTTVNQAAKHGSPRITDKGTAENAYSMRMNAKFYHDAANILRDPKSSYYNPDYAKNIKISSDANNVLYGNSKTYSPGIMTTFGLALNKYPDGKPKIVFKDEEKAKRKMQDVLFKGAGRPKGRSLHVETIDGKREWKIKVPTEKGKGAYNTRTGEEYNILPIDRANADTRAFVDFLNFEKIEKLNPETFVQNVKNSIVSGAIEDERMLKALVQTMQGSPMRTWQKEAISRRMAKLTSEADREALKESSKWILGGLPFISNPTLAGLIGTTVGIGAFLKKRKRKTELKLRKERIRDKSPQEELDNLLGVGEKIKSFEKAWDNRDKKEVNRILGAAGWKKSERAAVLKEMGKIEDLEAKKLIDRLTKRTREVIGQPTTLPRSYSILQREEEQDKALGDRIKSQEAEGSYFKSDGIRDIEKVDVDYSKDDGLRNIQSVPQAPPVKPEAPAREEESFIPEPARGEFLEPEELEDPKPLENEIQDPEAKDRELRSSRINSFLKQQGAYKRSRRRRQIG